MPAEVGCRTVRRICYRALAFRRRVCRISVEDSYSGTIISIVKEVDTILLTFIFEGN